MSTPIQSLPGAAPVLSVRGIGKTYAGPVLADISLDLYAGEVLALTGENRCGQEHSGPKICSAVSSRRLPAR